VDVEVTKVCVSLDY